LFINSCSDLLLEEVDNIVKNAGGDGNVLVNPGSVSDGGDLDW